MVLLLLMFKLVRLATLRSVDKIIFHKIREKNAVLSLCTYKASRITNLFKQVKKALELYEQLRQRMGVVVIGPSGSGKSTIWKLLRLALGKVGQTVKHYTMNPKAMPRTQVGIESFICREPFIDKVK